MRYDRNYAGEVGRRWARGAHIMSASYLIQILRPRKTGAGERVAQQWFDGLLKEMTDRFGGATSFVRSPGEGLWREGSATERDSIAVVEIRRRSFPVTIGARCARVWSASCRRKRSSFAPRNISVCKERRWTRWCFCGLSQP